MRNKKVTGDDNVPGDVLKLLGEGGLKIMTKLINTIHEVLPKISENLLVIT